MSGFDVRSEAVRSAADRAADVATVVHDAHRQDGLPDIAAALPGAAAGSVASEVGAEFGGRCRAWAAEVRRHVEGLHGAASSYVDADHDGRQGLQRAGG